MQVIEGSFGQDEPTLDMKTLLSKVLSEMDLSNFDGGQFVLIIDGEERTAIVTNSKEPSQAVYLMQQATKELL